MKKLMAFALSFAFMTAGSAFAQTNKTAPATKTNAEAKSTKPAPAAKSSAPAAKAAPAKTEKAKPAESPAPKGGDASATALSNEVEGLLAKGKEMYIAGDLDAARAQTAKALKLDPTNAKAKKFMEKLGGEGAEPAKTAASPTQSKSSQAVASAKLVSPEQIDRMMKENIKEAFGNGRMGIYQYMSQSIKDEISNSVQRAVIDALIKDAVKLQVNAVAQELVKDEIERTLTNVMTEYGMKSIPIENQRANSTVPATIKEGSVPYIPTAINEKVQKMKAKDLFEQALKLASANSIDEARTMMEEAKKLDPTNEEITKALAKLKK